MTDERMKKLASNIIGYSCSMKAGENVLIESYDDCTPLVKELVRAAYAIGANPFVWLRRNDVQRELTMGANEAQLKLMKENDAWLMERMDAYIGVRGGDNDSEMSDVPSDRQRLRGMLYAEEVHGKIRVPKTKWCVLRYPSSGMAQKAGMSTEAFENYYFNVCNLDYGKMYEAMLPLKALMERTDRVRLTGTGTDISFSIKGLPAVPCAGNFNIPDGEIFSAPVQGSVNGVISYNTPSIYEGFAFENVVLTFKDGRITDVKANDTKRAEAIFDRDEGARSVGEFAIGVNPFVTKPMKDTLFDEKIAGSFHFTPGACYDECDNGNRSSVHWDLVMIQTPECGGGDMYFDDVLVRHDGRFVLPELYPLNPENLK